MRRVLLKTEGRTFAEAFSSNGSNEDFIEQRHAKRIKPSPKSKDPDDEYRDFVYSLFALCYLTISGTSQDKIED